MKRSTVSSAMLSALIRTCAVCYHVIDYLLDKRLFGRFEQSFIFSCCFISSDVFFFFFCQQYRLRVSRETPPPVDLMVILLVVTVSWPSFWSLFHWSHWSMRLDIRLSLSVSYRPLLLLFLLYQHIDLILIFSLINRCFVTAPLSSLCTLHIFLMPSLRCLLQIIKIQEEKSFIHVDMC